MKRDGSSKKLTEKELEKKKEKPFSLKALLHSMQKGGGKNRIQQLALQSVMASKRVFCEFGMCFECRLGERSR